MGFAAKLLVLSAFAAAMALRGADENLAARVVVVANSADPDSLRIAQHYAEVRGVPPANVIALKMPLGEVVSWREFVTTIWDPLLSQLVAKRWIEATPMALTDPVGRQKYAPYSHRIEALVVCRGVPLKIAHDPALFAEALPFTSRQEFRTNAGAVDAELCLLVQPNYPINAFVPNPLFQNDHPALVLTQMVKVARLDGPTAEDANALVDRAIAAERTGLLGRAYVDFANRDRQGDAWLESAASQLAELDFDVSVDREAATMPATARIDAPALYFGWYAENLDGPFTLPGFRFPPGAIALHIHSFSAATLRTTTSGWVAPFVARGVTATFGNVYEPYLQFTHRPDLLMRALRKGATLADAAYYSLPVLSWQAVLIGDPLYRPFAVPLDKQVKDLKALPARLAPYAALREMHRLDDAGRQADATALAVSTQHDVPSLVLAVALARRLRESGNAEAASNALGFVPLLKEYEANEWAVAREAAQLLAQTGRAGQALEVWRTLLGTKSLPREVRIAWLPEARKTAGLALNYEVANAWGHELNELTAPAEKK